MKCWIIIYIVVTFHVGECVFDFELTTLTVHSNLELHSVQLLPLLVAVASAQQAREVVYCPSHGASFGCTSLTRTEKIKEKRKSTSR